LTGAILPHRSRDESLAGRQIDRRLAGFDADQANSAQEVTGPSGVRSDAVVVTHREPEKWVHAHPDAPFTFVTDGLANAIEQAQHIAGEKTVGVTAGSLASQCLELGLLDEFWLGVHVVVNVTKIRSL